MKRSEIRGIIQFLASNFDLIPDPDMSAFQRYAKAVGDNYNLPRNHIDHLLRIQDRVSKKLETVNPDQPDHQESA